MQNNSLDLFKEEESAFDIKKWVYKFLFYWWLFAISLGVSISAGYLYLRYADYEYEAKSTLLIKNSNAGGFSEESILLQDRGLIPKSQSLTNQIQIFKSRSLMTRVVENLNLNLAVFRIGRIKERELYSTSPLRVDSFSLTQNGQTQILYLNIIDDNSFEVTGQEDGDFLRQTFGIPFILDEGYFLIDKNENFSTEFSIQKEYRIDIYPVEQVAAKYQGLIDVAQIGDQWTSSVLQLSLRDFVPKKAEEILNTLIQVYNEEEINEENKILKNTTDFIDGRLAELESDLEAVEGTIENYKSSNTIATNDATLNVGITLTELNRLEQQRANLEIQESILHSFEEQIIKNEDTLTFLPVNLLSDQPMLSNAIKEYNGLLVERNRLLESVNLQNEAVQLAENRIAEIRQLIWITIQTLKKEVRIPIQKNIDDINKLKSGIQQVPTKEKELVERLRQQSIKENLYLFLLQKKEETDLSIAITASNSRIIDKARSTMAPIAPQKRNIYVMSLILGLLVPILFIFLREFLYDKVESEDEIRKRTNIPIIGRIESHKGEEKVVVTNSSRSPISEMFRLMRTNIYYLNPDEKKQVVLITSSQSGEGKTFITLNLAMTMALLHKRVIVIGLDLRKPKLYQYLEVEDNNIGMTNWLVGDCEVEDIIFQSKQNENLYYIASGPIPPNPSELLLSQRMLSLIATLKTQFDHIIIDTPSSRGRYGCITINGSCG